ncbi:MAG: extracellular solute-binding protein [Ruminococcaceae bacterium]|nr:extracellular solute-binding protein [Oscillospiraceae bacterium]
MRKIISLALALTMILSLLSLAGCHKKVELPKFDVPAEFDENKQYTISFWAKNDTNLTQVEIYKKAIADFEKIYPNIKVNLELYTDYGRIYEDVIRNIATKTTPNVCITYPDHIATYMQGSNVVVPLDELMSDAKYGLGGSAVKFDSVKKDEIVGKFLNECVIDGKHYALPFLRSTEACYINKTYVEKLGYTVPEKLTWDFIWEVSEAALAKESDGETFKVNGQKTLIPFIYKSTDNMMIQMVEQKGTGYSNASGDNLLFNDSTKSLLFEIADHAKSKAFSTFKISSYPANFLNRGQCIFAIDSTAGASWMGTDAPNMDIAENEIVEFETVVKTIPQYNTEAPKMISQGPSVCLFNKESKDEVLASWLFLQYLLTNDVQISYASTEGYIPVTTKAHNSNEYQSYLSKSGENNELYYSIKLDATKLVLNNINNTFVTPVFNGSASLRNAAGQLIEEVTKAARRNKTVDDAYVANLYKEMNALYKLNEKK